MILFVEVFSANQIRDSFFDDSMQKIIDNYMPVLRHSVMFVIPRRQNILKSLAQVTITAPAISMTIATLNDVQSILLYDERSELVPLLDIITIRILFLGVISAILWIISVNTLIALRELSARLFSD